jgi:hypothetical protein
MYCFKWEQSKVCYEELVVENGTLALVFSLGSGKALSERVLTPVTAAI